MKVSALWITKNEEGNIARAIESVAAIADELVVVDTGSTDGTVAAAEAAGARVVPYEWTNDFAAARNFAMDQVDGDVLVFADADEWFEPALGDEHRRWLEQMFLPSRGQVVRCERVNIDQESGIVIGVDKVDRIMRGKGAVAYVGVIHERLYAKNGGAMYSSTLPGSQLMHTGYATVVYQDKLLRNRELLLKAVEAAPDGLEKTLNTYYLMRENRGLGRNAESFENLKWLLEHPKPLREFLDVFRMLGRHLMFTGVGLAAEYRARVSRLQLKKSLVDAARDTYPDHPSSLTVELFYDTYFDNDEAALLAALPPAMEKAQKLEAEAEQEDYRRGNVQLYTVAGEAAWRRGDRELAFEYATRAVQQSEALVTAEAVALLLRCVRGLPAQDIILFLNSVLDTEKRGILTILISTTQYEGFSGVYSYYMKKMLDAGWAKKSDFWYLMIVLGQAQQAVEQALAAQADTEPDVVRRTCFLAAVCTGDEGLYRANADKLGRYAPVLEACFGGQPAEGFEIARDNYQLVAFAGGRQAANRLLAAAGGEEQERFALMAGYYNSAGLYAEFLAECPYRPEATSLPGQLQLANCHLMTGDTTMALSLLQQAYENLGVNDTWLNICAVVGEKGVGEIGAQAQRMARETRPRYERWVDRLDVVMTGVVMTADSKQQRRALAQMTMGQLREMAQPASRGPFAGEAEVALAAAEKYAEAKSYHEAMEGAAMALGHGVVPAKCYEVLAEVFEKVGNTALAGELAGQAE